MGQIMISDWAPENLGSATGVLFATGAGLTGQAVVLYLQAFPAQLKDA